MGINHQFVATPGVALRHGRDNLRENRGSLEVSFTLCRLHLTSHVEHAAKTTLLLLFTARLKRFAELPRVRKVHG